MSLFTTSGVSTTLPPAAGVGSAAGAEVSSPVAFLTFFLSPPNWAEAGVASAIAVMPRMARRAICMGSPQECLGRTQLALSQWCLGPADGSDREWMDFRKHKCGGAMATAP